jgi:NTP pyrophosphatase (non-canonical NTP hydrolase)
VVEHNTLPETIVSGLCALQAAQTAYDADMWDISDPKFANLRHIQLHLAITVGKLAKLLEPQDHRDHNGQDIELFDPDEIRSIIADLMIHAAQIANLQSLDLGQALTERYRRNALRFAPQSSLKDFGAQTDR